MARLIPYTGTLLKGALVTIELSALSLLFASIIGAVVGTAATSRVTGIRVLVKLYVELIRSVPLLVQLFFVYYAVPLLANISLTPYQAATLSLSVYGGAFMVEAVRSGIQSVGKDQWDAAKSLAIGYHVMMVDIIAPQALRVTAPAAIGIAISLLKASSQASIIGFVELLQTSLNIRDVTFSVSPVVAAAILYFVLCFALSRAGARIERAVRFAGH